MSSVNIAIELYIYFDSNIVDIVIGTYGFNNNLNKDVIHHGSRGMVHFACQSLEQ